MTGGIARDATHAPAGGAPSAGQAPRGRGGAPGDDAPVVCPFCGSEETELMSLFGSSPLTSQYYCRSCRTAFERVKWG